MKRVSKFFNQAVMAGVGALATCLALQAVPAEKGSEAKQTPPPQVKVDKAPVPRRGELLSSFAPVVKKVAPSVVNIYSTKTVQIGGARHPLFNDPMFRRFFGDQFGGEQSEPQSRAVQGLGSGVVVSENGYILTNNHVVENADEVRVGLPGSRREFIAEVVGTDPQTDIAVLRIPAEDLPAIILADSSQLEVGDVVLAIGNPFDVGQTVTMGIVSATGRGGFRIVDYEDFIQTDASINPGNSGGGLVDVEGRLVGINTAIISGTGANQGIGFAVPINLARYVMEQIIDHGKVTRGYLGVSIQPLTPDLARAFGLKQQAGALVSGVMPGTPAEKAELKQGDVIVEFNGSPVPDDRQLRLRVSQTPPDSEATLKIVRQGKEREVKLRLMELPSDATMAGGLPGRAEPGPSNILSGVQVTDLTPQARRQHSVPRDVVGALVTDVEPDSAAFKAGLRPGNVILEIDHEETGSAEEAVALSRKATDDQVLLWVWGQGGRYFVAINNPRARR